MRCVGPSRLCSSTVSVRFAVCRTGTYLLLLQLIFIVRMIACISEHVACHSHSRLPRSSRVQLVLGSNLPHLGTRIAACATATSRVKAGLGMLPSAAPPMRDAARNRQLSLRSSQLSLRSSQRPARIRGDAGLWETARSPAPQHSTGGEWRRCCHRSDRA